MTQLCRMTCIESIKKENVEIGSKLNELFYIYLIY